MREREDLECLKMEETKKQQVKAWAKKGRNWDEKRKEEEDERSLKIGRESEKESWARQAERLEGEKEEKEGMDAKSKKILGEGN